jgi:elongation factor 3
VRTEVANPECREVADRAHATLLRVGAKGKVTTPSDEEKAAEAKAVKTALAETVAADASGKKLDATLLGYVAEVALFQLSIKKTILAMKVIDEPTEWAPRAVAAVEPCLGAALSGEQAAKAAKAFVERVEKEDELKAGGQEFEEEDGEPLTEKPLQFSLAYGAKILLNNARLNLKRGKRYGLCGPNGCGKSTLMRSIANGQVKEFPPQDVLKTVYVEHDIDAEQTEQSVITFVTNDSQLKDRPVAEIESTLESVGFTATMRQKPIASLSGGWKMKLALARAMLWNADILLLDEPTNHLDVTNVAWLENYLTHLPTVTSIIVSHDSGFLDNVCTGIIHYEDLRLSQYKGNLSEFVRQKPEARSYYELSNQNLKFKFPEPGFLEGVKSKDRAILKMTKAGIRYEGMTENVISDVTIQCSLNSRVAIVGANGAGKSTMVKALIGELEAKEGVVWKHPNLRVAYVAQHAFHHLDKHLDKTPNQYIQWRYATGEDREGVDSVFRKATEEEEKKMAEVIKMADGTKKVVENILGRRKLKKSYEYEVQWKGLPLDKNEWLPRDQLEQMGWGKTLNEIDIKEAAKQGLVSRPLTEVNIARHLADFGVEEEFGNHAHIRGLSGGQKVKVVLAACTWLSPHIVILDEPTNYLDRDALGALAEAIKEYGGGIVMISHSSEFTSALCPEKWTVADGKLAIEGQTDAQKEQAKLEWKRQEEMTDAFGNTIKVKAPKKKLSNKEKKQRAKVRAARRDRGEEVSDTDEDE